MRSKFWTSYCFQIAFTLYLYCSFLGRAIADTTINIEKMIELSKSRQVQNLTCHVCHSEKDPGCLNMTSYDIDDPAAIGYPQVCGSNCTACMVKKVAFTTATENGTVPMKVVAIKRKCSSKCEPVCVIMGERTRLYVCSTCCTEPLCNVGSGALKLEPSINFFKSYKIVSINLLFMFLSKRIFL